MPNFRILFLLISLSTATAFASIDYLEQRFIEEESFTRISEYFDGIEVPGNRIVLRSEPEARTGHYVTFQLSDAYAVDHFTLEVYEYGSRDPVTYSFKVDEALPAGKPIYLGLTGEKWKEREKPPVAYKLSLIGKDGSILESATSFLWGDD